MIKNSNFTIRPATRRDMPAVVGIYNWAINQTFATIDSEPLSLEEASEWWTTHTDQSITTLVAEQEGDVVGWVRLLPWRQRGYEVVEDLIYVDPIYQRHGVGRRLLSEAIIAAGASVCRTMVASVAVDNQTGLRLHLNLGFEVVGTIRHAAHKFDRWMDITLLQREI
ncbi:MAG: GNAT family N-acetyltransferase [Candidatus Dormibacteraceae bacterium]